MRTLYCTNCGANLTIKDDNREFAFCEYCGAKIMLDDYRSTQRIVDEARIKQVEADKVVKLKRLELIEKQQNERKKSKKNKCIISLILAIIGILLMLIGLALESFSGIVGIFFIVIIPWVWILGLISEEANKNNDALLRMDMVRVPDNIAEYINMDYNILAKMLERAGFYNIQLVPMGDVVLGIFNTPNCVDRILINNEIITQGGGMYEPGAKVVIYYHSR